MDTKVEIKECDLLPDYVASHYGEELFTEDVTNNDALLLDDDCGMVTKREIKSEMPPFLDFDPQEETQYLGKYLINENKSEMIASSKISEIDVKAETEEQALILDFSSQIKREFISEDLVMKDKEYNIDHGMDNKIEIKMEPWWLETGTLPLCDDIKDRDHSSVTSSRLSLEAVSGNGYVKSSLPSAVVSRSHTSFYNEKDHRECECQETVATKIPTTEYPCSEQSDKCCDEEIYNRCLNSKQSNLIHECKKPHVCSICHKRFKYMSDLKRHESFHGVERPHMCKNCDKRFIQFSDLKKHNLIHEGKKPHQCKSCCKSFTQLSNLKAHNLIHEGKKPHQCKTCDKSFTTSSHLRRHNFIHEGKKPHQCKACNKCFTQLSHLKKHSLLHRSR